VRFVAGKVALRQTSLNLYFTTKNSNWNDLVLN